MKNKPTPEQLKPLFWCLVAIVREAGGELEIMPSQLWKKVDEFASEEAKSSPAFPKGKISLSMSIATLRPVFKAAGIEVKRPSKPDSNQQRPWKFRPVKASNQNHD